MYKQDIINVLQEAYLSHKAVLENGQILLDGINLDRVDEPVSCVDCHFSAWFKTHEETLKNFNWFAELKEIHTNLHNKYSVLFYESMRKYNPKTFEQLLERFDSLKEDVNSFTEKLNEIESDILIMSDEDFNKLVLVDSENDNESVDDTMKSIDINAYEEETNDSASITDDTSNAIDFEVDQEAHSDVDSEEVSVNDSIDTSNDENNGKESIAAIDAEKDDVAEELDESIISSEDKHTENLEETAVKEVVDVHRYTDDSETIIKHISLKEQYIEQLQNDKDLSKLELVHLEETQKLTQQSADQLERSFSLKQQELELEQSDNDRLINFKSNSRTETVHNLSEISKSTEELIQDIQDLEKQISVNNDIQEKNKSSETIAKQFDELKQNKQKDLDKQQGHLQIKKVDLKQLQDQVMLLEKEISEMESDISKKNQDMEDLKEKEKTKNEERAAQKAEFEKTQKEHHDSIEKKQIELDALMLKDQEHQKDLEVIDYQVDELKKINLSLDESNAEFLAELEKQKIAKHERIQEIDKLKESKQSEIDKINEAIAETEKTLRSMKSTLPQSEKELETA